MPFAVRGPVSCRPSPAKPSGLAVEPKTMLRVGIAASLRDCSHTQPLARSFPPTPSAIAVPAFLGMACTRAGQEGVLCRGGNSEASSSFEASFQEEDGEDENQREGSGDSSESSGVTAPRQLLWARMAAPLQRLTRFPSNREDLLPAPSRQALVDLSLS